MLRLNMLQSASQRASWPRCVPVPSNFVGSGEAKTCSVVARKLAALNAVTTTSCNCLRESDVKVTCCNCDKKQPANFRGCNSYQKLCGVQTGSTPGVKNHKHALADTKVPVKKFAASKRCKLRKAT